MSMRDPEWLDPTEQAAWRGFLQSHAHLSAVLGRELQQDAELSMQDYAVLVALSESPEGSMRAYELGARLAWEKSRLSHHIARMIDRGLVARQKCKTDQRGTFVTITPVGRKTIRAAAPRHVAGVRRHFIEPLTKDEVGALERISAKLLKGLNDLQAGECEKDPGCADI
jgi:DNA-binding MarR family transcriptional regulator